MEQDLPVLPKKVWSILRLFYFMLRKGVSKNKIWLDLNLMIKRAKIAGKALQNLLFHHHHVWAAFAVNRPESHLSFPSPPPGEYEYSCTTTPSTSNHKFSLFSYHKKQHMDNKPNVALDVAAFNAAVLNAIEMVHSENMASPVLPGFGRSPVVRQLRVTDSPFPLSSVDEDNHVDEAAEQFIIRFYNDLQRQKQICGGDTTMFSGLLSLSLFVPENTPKFPNLFNLKIPIHLHAASVGPPPRRPITPPPLRTTGRSFSGPAESLWGTTGGSILGTNSTTDAVHYRSTTGAIRFPPEHHHRQSSPVAGADLRCPERVHVNPRRFEIPASYRHLPFAAHQPPSATTILHNQDLQREKGALVKVQVYYLPRLLAEVFA